MAAEAPEAARSPRAIGHRIVHGGAELRKSVRIAPDVREAIDRATELAPLHNPPALAALDAAQKRFPDVPHVAVFDTSFFASLPERARVYPLPYAWYRDWGIRRYGFHGLSHAYCSAMAGMMLARSSDPPRRVVTLHLGNGCSGSAVLDGNPVATTMGFTPLEGLMMGTRPGSVDPGILTYVQERRGLDAHALDRALNHESGLLGVSGVSSDLREVMAAAAGGNERARLASEIYADRARQAVGALAVTMGGVDALVFTGGVGEHSADMRSAICVGLQCLGLRLDAGRNAAAAKSYRDIALPGSEARILVLHTREERMIASETMGVLSG